MSRERHFDMLKMAKIINYYHDHVGLALPKEKAVVSANGLQRMTHHNCLRSRFLKGKELNNQSLV